jgi:hypothetical protein
MIRTAESSIMVTNGIAEFGLRNENQPIRAKEKQRTVEQPECQ